MPRGRLTLPGNSLIRVAAWAMAAWSGFERCKSAILSESWYGSSTDLHQAAPRDTLSRIMAERAYPGSWGKTSSWESEAGSRGQYRLRSRRQAEPDGYTLGLVTGGHAISGGALYNDLRFQPVDSFEMISTIVYYALVVAVRSDYPAKTLGELIAIAKAKPGSLSFGSVALRRRAPPRRRVAEKIGRHRYELHVPYRGDSQAIAALLSGDMPMIIGTAVLVAPQVESGAVPAALQEYLSNPQRAVA